MGPPLTEHDIARRLADCEREVIALRERFAVIESRSTAQSTLIIENTRITQSASDSLGSLRESNDKAVAALRADLAGLLELMQDSRSLVRLLKYALGAVAAVGAAVTGYLGIRRLWP